MASHSQPMHFTNHNSTLMLSDLWSRQISLSFSQIWHGLPLNVTDNSETEKNSKSEHGPDTESVRQAVNLFFSNLQYQLRTLWLFTKSDIKSMIYPNLVFSVACSASNSSLGSLKDRTLTELLCRLPYVLAWLWLNLLLFNLENQRLPSSIVEDSVNKPWRPLPSRRLDAKQARNLMFTAIPAVVLLSYALGVTRQALGLIALTWAYNDFGGADRNFVERNLINALGMSLYSSGAVAIASGNDLTWQSLRWITLVGAVVGTTVHVQDIKDQEGDATRQRKTLPLVMGDGFARRTLSPTILIWSFIAPSFWRLHFVGYIPSVIIGGTMSVRLLHSRSVEADKGTWTLWCIWMVSLYLLPIWS